MIVDGLVGLPAAGFFEARRFCLAKRVGESRRKQPLSTAYPALRLQADSGVGRLKEIRRTIVLTQIDFSHCAVQKLFVFEEDSTCQSRNIQFRALP